MQSEVMISYDRSTKKIKKKKKCFFFHFDTDEQTNGGRMKKRWIESTAAAKRTQIKTNCH